MVALDAAAVPLLEGAAECASGGYLSSLHPENARAAAVVEGGLDGLQAGLLALLVDPQTGQWCACSSSARLCDPGVAGCTAAWPSHRIALSI
jgi:selenide,water dikinase